MGYPRALAGGALTRYLLARLAALPALWLGISLLAFGLAGLAPGDPASVIASRLFDAPPSQAQIDAIARELGLDAPAHVRYFRWLGRALEGDLGRSYRTGESVLSTLAARLPATLEVAAAALGVALAIALPLGVAAAVGRGSRLDHAARAAAVLGASIPSYWLGYLLVLVFAVGAGWLPVAGREQAGALLLPALTLGLVVAAPLGRLTRASMLEVLGEEFVRTARAKGLPERLVLWRHAARGAAAPLVTAAGLVFGHLLGGAVIVEQVFAWPGLGRLLLEAIGDRDVPLIQGYVLLAGASFSLVNLAVDLACAWIDPRLRLRGKGSA